MTYDNNTLTSAGSGLECARAGVSGACRRGSAVQQHGAHVRVWGLGSTDQQHGNTAAQALLFVQTPVLPHSRTCLQLLAQPVQLHVTNTSTKLDKSAL